MEVDEILWCMKWSAALAPEQAMIPDRSVFLRSSMGRSLTATVEGVTSDIWEEQEHVGDASDAGDVDVLGDVEVVEEICCCTTHEPGLENKVSHDRVLFV
jgi:hypothetical protein